MSVRLLSLAACAIPIAGWTSQPAHARATPSITYVARMSGALETPANNARGTGTASFTLDGTTLKFTIQVSNLSGAPTAAHIHVGAAGVAGPPVYTFALKPNAGATGQIAEGTIALTKDASAGVSGDSLKVLLNNGHAYVNVHTKNFPGGEIRGQVMTKP